MTNETRRRELDHLRSMVGTAKNYVANALMEAEGAYVDPEIAGTLEIALYYVRQAHAEVRAAYTDEMGTNE